MAPRFLDEDGNPIDGWSANEAPERHEVIQNETFILNCEVDANPEPQITWTKDGEVTIYS